jgi:hypothetical protein
MGVLVLHVPPDHGGLCRVRKNPWRKRSCAPREKGACADGKQRHGGPDPRASARAPGMK